MTCCGNARYDCDGMMCNDCHPKGWDWCKWCDVENDRDARYHHNYRGSRMC